MRTTFARKHPHYRGTAAAAPAAVSAAAAAATAAAAAATAAAATAAAATAAAAAADLNNNSVRGLLGGLSKDSVQFFTGCIVSLLALLHSKSIAFRDLKPENLLVDKTGFLVVVDFGFAKIINKEMKSFTLCGSAEYLAPEVVTRRGHGQSVDFWSLGVIVYEMMYGVTPFFAETNRDIFKRILQGDVEFPTVNLSDSSSTSRVEDGAEDGVEDGVESCCDLILRLLDQAPMTRLGALLDG